MNRKDIIRICLLLIVFLWISMATMPYRLGVIQNAAGHFYDEKMASQEFLLRKRKEKLAKMPNVSLETKLDCDEALAATLWAYFKPEEAADILAKVKIEREKEYKSYNPQLIKTMVLLATVDRDLSRLEQANSLYEEVWSLDKINLLAGDKRLTIDQTNLAVLDYLRADSEEKQNIQKNYLKHCLAHVQLAQKLWHEEKDPDVAKLANLFFLQYLVFRDLGDEANSKTAYGEMKYLDKKTKHICFPPRT